MKKFLIVSFLLLVSAFAVGQQEEDCPPGHQTHVLIEISPGGMSVSVHCCIPVGDGSALSCTDGETWWNEPNLLAE